MKERLEAILKHEHISPSKLADIIGVQRSGISHIMSGRNKPGLDFLVKLLEHFPHINGDWLITGEGAMLKNASNKPVSSQMSIPLSVAQKNEPKEAENPKIKIEKAAAPDKALADQQMAAYKTKSSTRTIERIVVFYNDKSFSEYLPE